MAALSEDGRYGLNCGRQSADRVTVLHVKLTETALKAIECHQKSAVSRASVYFYLFIFFTVKSTKTDNAKRSQRGSPGGSRGFSTPPFPFNPPASSGSPTATHR